MAITANKQRRAMTALSNRFDGAGKPNGARFDGQLMAANVVNREGQKGIAITIRNVSAQNLKFALFLGLLNTIEDVAKIGGEGVDYIAQNGDIKDKDGVKVAEFYCENLDYWRRYVNSNPLIISAIQFNAKDNLQLQQPISFKKVDPFMAGGATDLIPMQYQLSQDSNTTLINIATSGLVLGDKSLFTCNVAQGNYMTMTLFPNLSIDTFETLMQVDESLTK